MTQIAIWDDLSRRDRSRLRNRVKHRLNTLAAERMTRERLVMRDPLGEVAGWLKTITHLISGDIYLTPIPLGETTYGEEVRVKMDVRHPHAVPGEGERISSGTRSILQSGYCALNWLSTTERSSIGNRQKSVTWEACCENSSESGSLVELA